MPLVQLTTASVIYAAQTRVTELADIICESSSLKRVEREIRLAAKLLKYIVALQNTNTITFDEKQAICQAMIRIGDLYDFVLAPSITENQYITIGQPGQGPTGPQGPQGPQGETGPAE